MIKQILWLDLETLALDPTVASISEMAYIPEAFGETYGLNYFPVQPIMHCEDHVFGDRDLSVVVKQYNARLHDKSPEQLVAFKFPMGVPLFFYSRNALTFNVPVPEVKDPSEWLLRSGSMSARKVLEQLILDIESFTVDPKMRWVLAGHNVSFDHAVLSNWATRLLGEKEAKERLLNKINSYVFLDTLSLVRWNMYCGSLDIPNARLETVAKHLKIKTTDHTAASDVETSRTVAKLLLGV